MTIKNLIKPNETILINGHVYFDDECTNYGDIIITDQRILTMDKEKNITITKNSNILGVRYIMPCKYYNRYGISLCQQVHCGVHFNFPNTIEWVEWSEKILSILSKNIT